MHLKKIANENINLVSLTALKEHLKVEHNEDDEIIKRLQIAAYNWVQNYTGRSLLCTGWQYIFDTINYNCEVRQALPFPSIISIDGVYHLHNAKKEKLRHFVTENKNEVTYLCFLSKGLPVMVNYSSGFGNMPSEVPEEIHLAIKSLVASWYENKEGKECAIPSLVEILLKPFQIRRLI